MAFIKEEKDVKLEKLVLVPHFVIKTKIFTPYKVYGSGTKFFINVCSNEKIPTKELKDEKGKPIAHFDAKLIFERISNGEWEIPILTSPEIRETLDKKKNKSLLIDCAINDKYIKWCMVNEDLKDILIQWCIDAVEFQAGGNFVIDRDSVSLPKRTCIGGNPPDINVDLHHLKNISKELEDLSRDIYEGNDDPMMVVNAKLSDDFEDESKNSPNDDELPPLIPLIDANRSKNMIVEVGEEEKPKENFSLEKKTRSVERPDKIRFEVSMSKLPEFKTQMNHKYELQISSQLQSYKDYSLEYDSVNKDLIISNLGKTDVPLLKFPLPLDVSGDKLTAFFIKKEKRLYVYIK